MSILVIPFFGIRQLSKLLRFCLSAFVLMIFCEVFAKARKSEIDKVDTDNVVMAL